MSSTPLSSTERNLFTGSEIANSGLPESKPTGKKKGSNEKKGRTGPPRSVTKKPKVSLQLALCPPDAEAESDAEDDKDDEFNEEDLRASEPGPEVKDED